MLPNHVPNATLSDLRTENEALSAQIQPLQADRTAAGQQQKEAANDEQRQVRFHTVFQNSPLGQKTITPDLTIRQANPALVAMLGCTHAEQVEGRHILDLHTRQLAPLTGAVVDP